MSPSRTTPEKRLRRIEYKLDILLMGGAPHPGLTVEEINTAFDSQDKFLNHCPIHAQTVSNCRTCQPEY